MPISEGQRLCDADLELHVRDIELACFHARESDRFGIRIDAYDLRRVRRAPERHAPVTAADVDHALAADQTYAAVFSELVLRRGPEQ